jgi:hypothetical protein
MQNGGKVSNNLLLQLSDDKSAVSVGQDSPSKLNGDESSKIIVNVDAYSEYIE